MHVHSIKLVQYQVQCQLNDIITVDNAMHVHSIKLVQYQVQCQLNDMISLLYSVDNAMHVQCACGGYNNYVCSLKYS